MLRVQFIANRIRRFLTDETGQMLLLFALLLPVLFGFTAIAIDIGILRYQKEQLQTAADAAAISGALEISYCNTADCSAMTTAAKQALAENGFTTVTLNTQCGKTTSNTGITLTLNNGPCEVSSDPNHGKTGYVEAVISKPANTYFARIFGIKTMTISARAEAARGASPYCMYLSVQNTSASAGDALLLNGNGTIKASCGTLDDSGASPALLVNGNAKLETTRNDVHGTALLNGNPTVTPAININAPPLPDPLSYLKPPNSTGCTYNNKTINGKSTVTLNPGTYCGGLTVNGKSTVTLNPGVYYMKGSFIENGGDTVSGNGVMFYFSSGSMTLNGNSHFAVIAPTTGTYAGILYYQNPSDSSTVIINGNDTSVYQGTFYAPGAQLLINGNGNLAAYTNIVAASLLDNGNATFNLGDNYSSLPGGDPIKGVTAVLAE